MPIGLILCYSTKAPQSNLVIKSPKATRAGSSESSRTDLPNLQIPCSATVKGFARKYEPPRSIVFQHLVEILQLGHWNVSRKRIPQILSGIHLQYQILLSFHHFLQCQITTWLKVMENARKWGPGSKGPLAGPDTRSEISHARCRGSMQLQSRGGEDRRAFSTTLAHRRIHDALTSWRGES
jgi:hypothetical protein